MLTKIVEHQENKLEEFTQASKGKTHQKSNDGMIYDETNCKKSEGQVNRFSATSFAPEKCEACSLGNIEFSKISLLKSKKVNSAK